MFHIVYSGTKQVKNFDYPVKRDKNGEAIIDIASFKKQYDVIIELEIQDDTRIKAKFLKRPSLTYMLDVLKEVVARKIYAQQDDYNRGLVVWCEEENVLIPNNLTKISITYFQILLDELN